MSRTVNKPEFLKVGAVVKVQHWYGKIVDVAVTETNRVLVLVASPKGIWRNHPAEWLEYQEGQITPSSLEEAAKSIDVYIDRVEGMLANLKETKAEWIRQLKRDE